MIKLFILAKYLHQGGAEKILAEIYDEMPDDIHAQLVLIYNIPSESYERKSLNAFCLGISESYLHAGIFGNIIGHILCIIKYSILLIRKRPDISFGFGDMEVMCNLFSGLITKVKIIQSYRNNVHFPYALKIIKILNKYVILPLNGIISKTIIVNSMGNKDAILSYGVSVAKVITIYNPTDIAQINYLKSQSVKEGIFEKPTIVTVGRCVPEKGHRQLIRIFSKIHEDIDCRLIICGNGRLFDDTKKLAEEFHLMNDVILAGACDNPYKYMVRSTVFAFPSIFEGLPNALIEAMVCGCAIVSADCNFGPREILHNGYYGFLSLPLDNAPVDATSPLVDAEIDMKNKIVQLLVDNNCRGIFSNRCKEAGFAYDKHVLIEKYYEVIRNVSRK